MGQRSSSTSKGSVDSGRRNVFDSESSDSLVDSTLGVNLKPASEVDLNNVVKPGMILEYDLTGQGDWYEGMITKLNVEERVDVEIWAEGRTYHKSGRRKNNGKMRFPIEVYCNEDRQWYAGKASFVKDHPDNDVRAEFMINGNTKIVTFKGSRTNEIRLPGRGGWYVGSAVDVRLTPKGEHSFTFRQPFIKWNLGKISKLESDIVTIEYKTTDGTVEETYSIKDLKTLKRDDVRYHEYNRGDDIKIYHEGQWHNGQVVKSIWTSSRVCYTDNILVQFGDEGKQVVISRYARELKPSQTRYITSYMKRLKEGDKVEVRGWQIKNSLPTEAWFSGNVTEKLKDNKVTVTYYQQEECSYIKTEVTAPFEVLDLRPPADTSSGSSDDRVSAESRSVRRRLSEHEKSFLNDVEL